MQHTTNKKQEIDSKEMGTECVARDKTTKYRIQSIIDIYNIEVTAEAYNDCKYTKNDIVVVWYYDHWDVCRITHVYNSVASPETNYGIIIGHIDNFNAKMVDLHGKWIDLIERKMNEIIHRPSYRPDDQTKYLNNLWDTYKALIHMDL